MTCCKVAQKMWNLTPCICRSFEVGNEKGRAEENEFDNLNHHPQFHFPESWGGKRKKRQEENVICLPQVHDMLQICTNNMKSYPLHFNLPEFWGRKWKGQNWREWFWQPIPPPTNSFSRVLRWEKENDRGRKCNLPAAGAWHVENLHKKYEILPPAFQFAGVLR